MEKNRVFTAKVGGEDKELRVNRPTLNQQREGQKVYNRAFNDAVSSGALLRLKLDDFMREQGLWDDEKQTAMASLMKDISEHEKTLAKGGIPLFSAKGIALEMRVLRDRLRTLLAERNSLDTNTAEGQADNERFNYWVSVCTVYNDSGKPVFSSVDDYLENGSEDYALDAARQLAELLYGLDSSYEQNLAENKFLIEFGFANDSGKLVDKEGRLINADGKLINEDGFLIDEGGNLVDSEGNPIDEGGNYLFERQPFLDEDGNPI